MLPGCSAHGTVKVKRTNSRMRRWVNSPVIYLHPECSASVRSSRIPPQITAAGTCLPDAPAVVKRFPPKCSFINFIVHIDHRTSRSVQALYHPLIRCQAPLRLADSWTLANNNPAQAHMLPSRPAQPAYSSAVRPHEIPDAGSSLQAVSYPIVDGFPHLLKRHGTKRIQILIGTFGLPSDSAPPSIQE